MKKILLVLAVVLALSFTAKKFKMKQENLVYIPSGSFFLNDTLKSVFSFIMTKSEVTNGEYKLFLNDLKAQNRIKDLEIAKIDTALWETCLKNGKPLAIHYFRHTAYENYPVVNVSKQGAELYCEWYTDKMNQKYGKNGKLFQRFRLPMKAEWIYAAKGGLKNSPYPWGVPYTRNAKGDYLANFAHIGDRNIKKDENGNFVIVDKDEFQYSKSLSNSYTVILAPKNSYLPNGYGLYNMAGNANEMIADENLVMGGDWRSAGYDIRVVSEKAYKKANPMTGFRMVSSYTGDVR